jgi:MinD-like ATPase involved in chromosome partitioning or flagellar assembly
VGDVLVVVVVASGAAWESQVLGLVGAESGMVVLKRCVDVDEALATGTSGQADAAVVAFDAPGLDPTAVDLLHRQGLRVVAIGPDDEAGRTRASRIGVDVLVGRDDLHLLTGALRDGADGSTYDGPAPDDTDDTDVSARPAVGGSPGRSLVVWGPAGAPGRTTLAVALAAALAGRGQRTTLVDADPYGGSVAQQLGVLDEVSGLLSAARLTGDGALEARLATVQRSLGERLTVVTGLPRADRWVEVRAGVVEHLVEALGTLGHVVVDTGFGLEDDRSGDLVARPGRNQLTLGALEVADEVLVVGTADPIGLSRLARGLVDLREVSPGASVRVVVNRMRPTLGWSERDITGMVEGFARLVGVHFLPDDRAAADCALTAGSSIVDVGESDLAEALRALTDAVVPPPTARRRDRRRLLTRRA